jgi:hypothetical protein
MCVCVRARARSRARVYNICASPPPRQMSAHAQQLAALQTSLQYLSNPEAAAAAIASAGAPGGYGAAQPGPQSYGGPPGGGGAVVATPSRAGGQAPLGAGGGGPFHIPSGAEYAQGQVRGALCAPGVPCAADCALLTHARTRTLRTDMPAHARGLRTAHTNTRCAHVPALCARGVCRTLRALRARGFLRRVRARRMPCAGRAAAESRGLARFKGAFRGRVSRARFKGGYTFGSAAYPDL